MSCWCWWWDLNPRSCANIGFESDRLPSAEPRFCGERHSAKPNIPPEISELCVVKIIKKTTERTVVPVVLVVGLEPTCCHQHRILSPTRLPFHHTSTYKCQLQLIKYTTKFSNYQSFYSSFSKKFVEIRKPLSNPCE